MSHLYKVLVNGKSAHGGRLTWNLPTQDEHGEWQSGEWHRLDRPVETGDVCERGFHLTTNPMQWPKVGMQVFDAEGEGPSDTEDDKTAFTAARLLRPSSFEIPEHWRRVEQFVQDEIPSVRWFQPDGDPDPAWHMSVSPARDAAWAAARDAAWAAAWAAARDAAWDAARAAAWDAARDAARAAARDAAWAAARAAARDAAWAAARAAAWAAAGDAAGDAARAAAGDAAWDAARAAAGDTALYACMECTCCDLDVDQSHRDHVRARWNVWQKGYALFGDVDGTLYVYGVQS